MLEEDRERDLQGRREKRGRRRKNDRVPTEVEAETFSPRSFYLISFDCVGEKRRFEGQCSLCETERASEKVAEDEERKEGEMSS